MKMMNDMTENLLPTIPMACPNFLPPDMNRNLCFFFVKSGFIRVYLIVTVVRCIRLKLFRDPADNDGKV